MDRGLRLFSRRLTLGQRVVYGVATLGFAIIFVAQLWPVYPLLSRVRPMVLGVPLALFYLAALMLLSFLVLIALLLWELHTGAIEGLRSEGDEGEADGDAAPGRRRRTRDEGRAEVSSP